MPSDSAGEDEPIKTVMVMPWRLSVRVYGDGRGRLWAHLDDLIRVLGETCAAAAEEGDAIEEVEGIPSGRTSSPSGSQRSCPGSRAGANGAICAATTSSPSTARSLRSGR